MKKLICLLLAVLCLCGTVAAYEVPESFEGQSLEQVMTAYMEEKKLDESNFSMAYFNTVTGETYNFNEEKFTIAGSCYKLPLNMYFYEMEAAGEITPETEIGRTGRTLAEIHEESIVNSNNQLSEALMYYWGDHTTYKNNMRKYFTMSDEEIKPDYYLGNYFCVRMMMDALRYLYTNQDSFPEMIELMKQSKPGEYFQRGVTDYEVAHKYGAVQWFYNDVGIIYTPQPYLLAVFTQYINNDSVCAEVAELCTAYNVWQAEQNPLPEAEPAPEEEAVPGEEPTPEAEAQVPEEENPEELPLEEEQIPEEEELIPEEVPVPEEVPPEPEAEPESEPAPVPQYVAPPMEPVEETFPWWVLTAGVAGVCLITLIILIATRKRKPRSKYDEYDNYDDSCDDEDDEEDY